MRITRIWGSVATTRWSNEKLSGAHGRVDSLADDLVEKLLSETGVSDSFYP